MNLEIRDAYKPDALARLEAALASSHYRCRPLRLGVQSDPYQPRMRATTRQLLARLLEARHPVSLLTGSDRVLEDLDLLAPLARQQLCRVSLLLPTLDEALQAKLEPAGCGPARRLEALRALNRAGVPVGVRVAPLIPTINDETLGAVLEAARAAGARSADYRLIRLSPERREPFARWLAHHYPGRARHVLRLVLEQQGRSADRPVKGGYLAEQLAGRLKQACARLGLTRGERGQLNRRLFRPASEGNQLELFG